MLSSLSLNDISIISVLTLPISLEEVESIGSQLTFARIISGAQEPESPNGQDSQLPSSSALHEVLLPPIQPRVHEHLPAVKPRSAGKMTLYKLLVLGDGGTGKTELTIEVRVTQMS